MHTEGAVSSCMAICKWVNVSASSGCSSSSKVQLAEGSATTEGWRGNESVRRKKGHAIVIAVRQNECLEESLQSQSVKQTDRQ